MASKPHSALLDLQDEDSEINLQFQEFETQPTHLASEDSQRSQTIYFNSFPDSAEDDQRQKLLDDDDEEPSTKSAHSFWTFEYYQQFFDVESKQVGDRIFWSMVPKPGINFLQSYIRPNPDLYGPFWICATLVLTTAIAGNLSNYLQSPETRHWRYEFHKVTLATSSIFSYAWLVPLLIWGVLYWRGSKANISLLELICLYGYSLAIFVPVSLLWMVPLRWLQWCLGIVASVLSGSVLVRTIQPAVAHEAKKVALGLAVLILILHFALAIGFMLYFFYPPITTAPANVAPVNQSSIHDAVNNVPKENGSPQNQNDSLKSKTKDNSEVNPEKKDVVSKREEDPVKKKAVLANEAPNINHPPKALALHALNETKNVPENQTVTKSKEETTSKIVKNGTNEEAKNVVNKTMKNGTNEEAKNVVKTLDQLPVNSDGISQNKEPIVKSTLKNNS